jgi:hypothetical protein
MVYNFWWVVNFCIDFLLVVYGFGKNIFTRAWWKNSKSLGVFT